MKQIRKSVFETNSSSSHSISIDSTGTIDTTLIPNDDGILVIGPDTATKEFGWKQCTYTDAETKAVYAYIQALYSNDRKNMDMLYKVILDQTGADELIFKVTSDGFSDPDYGYIDHQSAIYETPFEPFNSEEDLRNFIFNKRSVLETDNDNH